MQRRNRIWFTHPVVCATVGIAAGLAYLGARIWLNPGARDLPDYWLRHRFGWSAILAVLVGSSLWLYGQKESGFTTKRRIHSAYSFLVVILVAILIVRMLLGPGPLFLAIAALLLVAYLWKVWRVGRHLPDAETSEPPST